ncbi:MAG TPA: hypothetical protein VIN06_17295 [Devosia sp.]
MIRTSLTRFVAIAVCAVTLGTAPVAAQSLGSDFSFGSGSGDSSEMQTFGAPRKGQEFAPACLTNRQIRRGLRDYGFEDVAFVRELSRNRVIVEALYEDDWYYSMRVHRCRGYVDRVRPLYPADEDY